MCRKAFDLHSVNVFIEKEIEYEDRFCSILCPDTVEESQDTNKSVKVNFSSVILAFDIGRIIYPIFNECS